MKDIEKLKDYRKKYKRYYGIDFGKEYAIHHIDGDRSNNDINNLLLLPSELHSRYHFLKKCVEGQEVPTDITGNVCNMQSYFWIQLESFLKTLVECNKWYDYKMYLEHKMPNIHGIEL